MQRAFTSRSAALARSSKLRSVTSQQLRFAHKVRNLEASQEEKTAAMDSVLTDDS